MNLASSPKVRRRWIRPPETELQHDMLLATVVALSAGILRLLRSQLDAWATARAGTEYSTRRPTMKVDIDPPGARKSRAMACESGITIENVSEPKDHMNVTSSFLVARVFRTSH